MSKSTRKILHILGEKRSLTRVARKLAGIRYVRPVATTLLRCAFLLRILASPSQRRHARRWLRSLTSGYLLETATPWLAFDAIDYLEHHLRTHIRVFEYGSGGSTLFWLRYGASCVSVEHEAHWYALLRPQLAAEPSAEYRFVAPEPVATECLPLDPADPAQYASADLALRDYSFRAYASQIDEFADRSFDVILIDGRARPSCIMHAARKVADGGMLILDNANRSYYTAQAGDFLRGFSRMQFSGVGPCGTEMSRTDIYVRDSDSVSGSSRVARGLDG